MSVKPGLRIADVRLSEQLDAVFVTPRRMDSGSEVFADLRKVLGPGVLRRSAEGIRVPGDSVR